MFKSRFTKTVVSMLAAAVVATVLIGCSDDDGDDGDVSNLVNGPNDAWIACEMYQGEEDCTGIAFRNGVVSNCWQEPGMNSNTFYQDDGFATYTTNGNRLVLVSTGFHQGSMTYTYSISGNTLHLTFAVDGSTRAVTFTRRTNLTFIRNVE